MSRAHILHADHPPPASRIAGLADPVCLQLARPQAGCRPALRLPPVRKSCYPRCEHRQAVWRGQPPCRREGPRSRPVCGSAWLRPSKVHLRPPSRACSTDTPSSTVGTTKAHAKNDSLDPASSRVSAMPSNPAAEKDTGFASQVVNPDGAKNDEARYGTRESVAAATTALPDRAQATVHSIPTAAKDAGLKRQIA